MVLGRRCREITESRPKNQLVLKNEEDVCLLLIKGSFRKTSRGWVYQLDIVPYLFWYDPFYHGSVKFKAKLGLGTVLLTSSYHSDSENGSCNKLFTNWVLVPYQEIQALGFPNSPRKLGLYEKPWACISWYGPCTQLVNSKYRPMFWASVDIHGCILFNFIVIIKIATDDSHLWSCVCCYQFLALCNKRSLQNNHICKFGKFHCVCNML